MTPRFEYAQTILNRVGRLLTEQELTGLKGFRSIYGFDEASCAYFESISRVKGSRGFTVYADKLFIDFDDMPDQAEKLYHILRQMEVGFEVWHSGNRSIHIEIPHNPLWSKHMPYTHKMFLKNLGVNCDWSIYSTARIFRLPGTVHQKTLKKKEILEVVTGRLMTLEPLEEPDNLRSYDTTEDDGIMELFATLTRFINRPPIKGERHMEFFKVVATCRSGGFSQEFTNELLLKLANELTEEDLDESTSEQLINSVY